MNHTNSFEFETNAVHGSTPFDPVTGAICTPIYQSATFRHPALGQSTGYDYSRALNPTREQLEKTLALLEGGSRGFAFSSGMAAISTAVKLFPSGSHFIVSDDLYGGTYRLFETIYRGYGLTFSYIDTSNLSLVESSFQKNTAAVFLETPSNPMMHVSDIAAIAKLSHERGAMLLVDNTFLTPYFQRPLTLGADIVLHSGTKYLGGHNDTLSGFIVINEEALGERIYQLQMGEGATLSPFDSYLVIRGIKTLPLRMERHTENAKKMAKFLLTHPNVENVYYTGLKDHPSYALSCKQTSGFGGMISFTVKNAEIAKNALSRIKLILFAESLGGTESLLTYPCMQTHAAIPQSIRDAVGVTDKLLRISVGIENISDLIADIDQALRSVAQLF